MNRTSTKTGKLLIGKIRKTKKSDFIKIVLELLEFFEDEILIDEELNIILLNTDSIFYCISTNSKDLEVSDFNFKNIEKIYNKYTNINNITILYNRNLMNHDVKEISRKFLSNFYQIFNIQLESYTPNALIEHIFSKSRDALYQTIYEKNKKFKLEYQERMSLENIYLENISYLENDISKINPKKNIHKNFIFKGTSKAWIFVKSEFGFGKTSLLLNLTDDIGTYNYIYIPISLFAEEAFINETELAENILSIISEKKFNTKEKLIDKILVTEFRQLLRSEKEEIVLLYDGLDEHHISYTENGLKRIFNCASSFSCNSIFTVRKEFLDERSGSFEDALDLQYKPKMFEVELINWNNINILEYIQRIERKSIFNAEKRKNLDKFKKLVNKNRYEEFYGDIPKRPLFLKMLIDDILSGKTIIKNISELYESYLIKKFKIDRVGSVHIANSSRPLSVKGDRNSKIDYIFELLAKIAWNMVEVNNFNVIYSEYIEEKKIKELLGRDSQFNEIIELLINSVLIPYSKRERRNFKAKFAHKSFHEYFLAYYLIYYKLDDLKDISPFILNYSIGTINFCKYMIENEDLQEKIDEIFRNLKYEIKMDNLISKLSTVDAHNQKYSLINNNKTDEKKKEYDLFISHSSQDKIPFVERLVCELSDLGLNVFFDKESIGISQNIVLNINDAFKNLKYGVIVVISDNFMESNWCNEELAIAYSLKVEKEKQFIPISFNIDIENVKEFYPITRATNIIDGRVHESVIAHQIKSLVK